MRIYLLLFVIICCFIILVDGSASVYAQDSSAISNLSVGIGLDLELFQDTHTNPQTDFAQYSDLDIELFQFSDNEGDNTACLVYAILLGGLVVGAPLGGLIAIGFDFNSIGILAFSAGGFAIGTYFASSGC